MDKKDSSKDKTYSSKVKKESSKDKMNSAKDKTDSSKNKTDSSKDKTDYSKDKTDFSMDKTDSSKDKIDSSKDKMDSSKDKAVLCKTKRPDEEINLQCDDKKQKKKAKLAAVTKLPKKDAAEENSYSDGEPASKIRKLMPDQKSQKPCSSSGDQLLCEQKSKSEANASMENEHNSSIAKNDLEDSDFQRDARVVPDVDDDVQKPAEEDSTQKTDGKQTSQVKAGKPSFMVPNIGSSSKPLENKANQASKKGFCPPVKTKTLENSSGDTLNQLKPKAAAIEKARRTAFAEDQIYENGGCNAEEDVNEAELSGGEEASAFDELADEVCSVAQEEGQHGGLQQLLSHSASLVGRTKEEKYTLDVQVGTQQFR